MSGLANLQEARMRSISKKLFPKRFPKSKKRLKRFGSDFDFENIRNKTVLVIDDGIATGETLYLAVKELLKFKPFAVIVAMPVSSEEGFEKLSEVAFVIAPVIDRYFYAVSQYYEEFPQLTEEKTLYYISESVKFESKGM